YVFHWAFSPPLLNPKLELQIALCVFFFWGGAEVAFLSQVRSLPVVFTRTISARPVCACMVRAVVVIALCVFAFIICYLAHGTSTHCGKATLQVSFLVNSEGSKQMFAICEQSFFAISHSCRSFNCK
ncbi:hypothetical protein, partial [Prevotellamassilia timonensis]|uniref:hypothetical protein n=1 Tax=Prevotellamassilia timonensis TaxID=1852370 RepID=UPI00307A07D0